MSVLINCPNCNAQIGTIKTEFVLQKEISDLRAQLAEANKRAQQYLSEMSDVIEKNDLLLKRIEEAEKCDPVAIVDNSCIGSIRWISGEFVEGTNLYTLPIPPADVAALRRDLAESEDVREMMKKILDDTAIALKGPNAELSLHSWHDLAEVASKNALDAGSSIAELERKLAEQQEELNKLLSEAREEGRKEAVTEDTIDAVSKAMRKAWHLGQTYWQQADSDSWSQNKKADATQLAFDELVDETRNMLSAPASLKEGGE